MSKCVGCNRKVGTGIPVCGFVNHCSAHESEANIEVAAQRLKLELQHKTLGAKEAAAGQQIVIDQLHQEILLIKMQLAETNYDLRDALLTIDNQKIELLDLYRTVYSGRQNV